MDFALDSLQSDRRDGERFDALAGLAARLAATPIAAVAFLDGPALRLAGRCGIGSPSIARAGWFCDETIASPGGLLVLDAGTDAPCLEGSTRARSYAGVPFGLPDEPPVGTIFVAGPFPFPTGSDPRPALAALAVQAAGLVELRRREVEIEQLRRKLEQRTDERRRAELEVRVRARQQAAIAELGQRALAGDELASVLQEAAELVARTLSVPLCNVMEIRGEPPLARLVAGVGWSEGIDDGPAGSLPTAGPLLYDDLATSPLASCPLLAAHGARCGAVVAIQDREGVRGYLGVHSRTPRAFTPDEADFLSVASQILGMAIRRKRNEEDLERTNRILDAVGRAQLEYISEAGGGRSFDRLVAELAAVSGCPRAFLAEAGPAAEGAPEPSLLAATDPSWAAQVLAASEPVREPDLLLPIRAGARRVGLAGLSGSAGSWNEETEAYLRPFLAACGHLLAAHASDRRRRLAEKALRVVAVGTSAEVGEAFFRSLVRHVAEAFDVRFAFVAEALEPAGTRSRILSMWSPAGFLEPFEYDVAGTPCEAVPQGGLVYHPSGVARAFPEDRWLADRGIESYMALAIQDSTGRPIGHIGILDDRPMPASPPDASVLVIFAARTGAELERIRAGERLRESRRVLSTLLSNLPGMAYRCRNDHRWTIELASAGALELTGYRVDELVGEDGIDFSSRIVPEDRERIWQAVQEAVARRQAYQLEYRLRRADGEVRWVWEQGRGVFDETGTLLALEGFAQDVTENRRAREQERRLQARIQHAEKMESLGVLAGGIAHDFNNLLMGVLGNAGLALQRMPAEHELRPLIERVETSARRAADLTNQLLAYSGKGRFVLEPIDLSQLTAEMADLLRVSISSRAELRLDLAPDLPPIEADPTQIRQIVMNLLTNASDSIGEPGEIAVRTALCEGREVSLEDGHLEDSLSPGSHVLLEIQDTGEGMDPDTLARMFEPFFTTKFTGRGLGLAAVQGIVRSHGGAIKVESAPGRGTRVRVYLPAAPHLARAAAAGGEPTTRWRIDATVLVVDDQETVRDTARSILEEYGFRVLSASGGLEGIEVLRTHRDGVDLALVDLTMPDADGEQVSREFRRLRPDLPILLSSGYSELEIAGRIADLGLAGFIQKPYRPDDLIRRIREAFGKATLGADPGSGRTAKQG